MWSFVIIALENSKTRERHSGQKGTGCAKSELRDLSWEEEKLEYIMAGSRTLLGGVKYTWGPPGGTLIWHSIKPITLMYFFNIYLEETLTSLRGRGEENCW